MPTNNIVICGVLDKKGSSNVWMAAGFQRLGFKIIPINYRTLIGKFGSTFFENLIIDCVGKVRPYLTIFCKCNGVNPEVISRCRKHSKTWLFFMDSFPIAQSCPEIIDHARRANFSSCTSEVTVEYFRKRGIANCFHIYEGIDYNIHKPVNPIEQYRADISFIGSRTPERDKYKEVLEKAGYKVKFYGPGYEESKYEEEWAKVCASSRFILSLNTFNDLPKYFSGRLFESLGCGTCTLHLDPTGSMDSIFKDRMEVIYFRDEADLLRKLDKIDATTARRVAINGRERVLNSFIWDHSVRKILTITGIKFN